MQKFKAGDRVRALESVRGQFTAGCVYSVRDCDPYGVEIMADDSGKKNGWSLDKFELAAACANPSPFRVITRREIIVGVHGYVEILDNPDAGLMFSLPSNNYTAEELREAAHILNQIAEVLEDG